MPVSQFNLELANHNARRSYPLSSDAKAKDVTGSFELPQSFLCGMSLAVPSSLEFEPGHYYLSEVAASGTGWTLTFSHQNGGSPVPVAVAAVPASLATKLAQFTIVGLPPFEDVYGTLMIWDATEIKQQPAGAWAFGLAEGGLDPFAVRPQLRSLQRIVVVNGSQRSDPIVGPVEFYPDRNMSLSVERPIGQPPRILFSAVSGAGLNAPCECDGAASRPCVKMINDVPPDEDNDNRIYLRGKSPCIEISGSGNTVEVDESCCEPCDTCEPNEEVTRALVQVREGRGQVTAFVAALEGTVASFQAILAGSNIGGAACSE